MQDKRYLYYNTFDKEASNVRNIFLFYKEQLSLKNKEKKTKKPNTERSERERESTKRRDRLEAMVNWGGEGGGKKKESISPYTSVPFGDAPSRP